MLRRVFGTTISNREMPALPEDEANPDEARPSSNESTRPTPARPDSWSLLTWAQGIGVHEAIAFALHQDSDAAALDFVRNLKGRDNLESLLLNSVVLEQLVDIVWKEVQLLQRAGDSSDIASKFSGAIELSYSGLDTFFDGLEGVLGAPSPKIHESMAAEHLDRADSQNTFVTDNYGVATTSTIEWLFVTADGDLADWPAESVDKLPDRTLCRKPIPLADMQREAEVRNEQLRRSGHTMLIAEEVIAARLYSGPAPRIFAVLTATGAAMLCSHTAAVVYRCS